MQKLHEKRLISCLFCIALVLVLIVVKICAMWEMRVKTRDLAEYKAINPTNVEYLLERNEFTLNKQDNKNHIFIDGWIAAYGMNSAPVKIQVAIYEDYNKAYVLPTEVSSRDDVNDAMEDGYDHEWSGFSTHIICPDYINIEDGTYMVSIIYTIGDTEYIINTEEEVCGGDE